MEIENLIRYAPRAVRLKPSAIQGKAHLCGTRTPTVTLSTIDYRLSAISYRLSTIAYRLSAIGYQSSPIGYRLSPIGRTVSERQACGTADDIPSGTLYRRLYGVGTGARCAGHCAAWVRFPALHSNLARYSKRHACSLAHVPDPYRHWCHSDGDNSAAGCSRPQPISDNSGSCHDGSIPDL